MPSTNYLEAKILDHVLRNTTYTAAATVYLALYTATPNDTGGGTEVTGGSYARNATSFSAASGGSISNSAIETFTNMPAATVISVGIFDASSGGNLLLYGNLVSNIIVTAASEVEFGIGDITVTLE